MLDLFLSRRPSDAVPFWMMRQAGRYLPEYHSVRKKAGGFMALCLTPEYASEVTLQPVRRFGLSAAILFSDILMIPYGLGQSVDFLEGKGPVLGSLDVIDLRVFPADFLNRLNPILETVRKVRLQEPHVPLIGFAGGPWTVACYMIQGRGGNPDFFEAKAWAYHDPERFKALLDLLVQATLSYVNAQIEAGCQIIQLFESAAGILSPYEWDEWVVEIHQHIIQKIHILHPGIPVIGFPRGAGDTVISYAQTTGVDGITVDAMTSSQKICDALPDVVIQGGLHPDLLRIGGTPLLCEVDRLCEAYRNHPYILNLSHGVHPQTPVEHVRCVVEHLLRRVHA